MFERDSNVSSFSRGRGEGREPGRTGACCVFLDSSKRAIPLLPALNLPSRPPNPPNPPNPPLKPSSPSSPPNPPPSTPDSPPVAPTGAAVDAKGDGRVGRDGDAGKELCDGEKINVDAGAPPHPPSSSVPSCPTTIDESPRAA